MTMQSTKQNAGGIAGFVDDLNGAIRENPVAAGLVGMGVLWMFFGSARISAFGSALPGAAMTATKAVGAAAEVTGGVVGEAIAGTASRVSEAARQVGGAISSGAEGAATMVRDTASAGYDALKLKGEAASETMTRTAKDTTGRSSSEYGREIGLSVQQNLTQTLERQPLLLGVIGLAIGAGIASAFPSTKIEQDMMGEAGAAVKDKIQEIATETSEFASQRAKDVLHEVKKEAAAQGLTSHSAKESLKGVVEKVKTAATSSSDSIKGRLS
jgi:hypothetical protein